MVKLRTDIIYKIKAIGCYGKGMSVGGVFFDHIIQLLQLMMNRNNVIQKCMPEGSQGYTFGGTDENISSQFRFQISYGGGKNRLRGKEIGGSLVDCTAFVNFDNIVQLV